MIICPLVTDWGTVADWVGGLLTGLGILAAVYLAQEPERQNQRQQKVKERSQVQYLALKLAGMLPTLEQLYAHFSASPPNDWPREAGPQRWRYIIHPIGLENDGKVRISESEISTFLDSGQVEFAYRLALFSRLYASDFEMITEFRVLRRQLEKLPVEEAAPSGSRIAGYLEGVASGQFAALAEALEGHVEMTVSSLGQSITFGRKLLSEFQQSAREALGDRDFELAINLQGVTGRD